MESDINNYSICVNCDEVIHTLFSGSFVWREDDGNLLCRKTQRHIPNENYRSHKFGNDIRAEILWGMTLDNGQTEDLGEADTFGWFAYFKDFRAILQADSEGFVSVAVYDGPEADKAAADHWDELATEYSEWLEND